MRHASICLGAAAAVAALALPPGAGGGAVMPPRAAAGTCAWHTHVRRHVVWIHHTHASLRPHRHVNRVTKRISYSVFRTPTGHWHRRLRVRRWRTCDPVPPGRLQVTAREWSFLLSRPVVPSGEVIVELSNEGEDAHNLHLQLADGSGPDYSIDDTDSEQRSQGDFELAPGTYRMWCTLPTHDTLGMHATLLVR